MVRFSTERCLERGVPVVRATRPSRYGSPDRSSRLKGSYRVRNDGRPTSFRCTNCSLELASLEELATHLERHREVNRYGQPKGSPLVAICSKGCGREFGLKCRPDLGVRMEKKEYECHILTCDGSEPLA